MATGLQISDFELERASFEIRYTTAYWLWDRAGQIWSEAQRKWPDIKVREAEPRKTVFTTENRYQLSVQLELAYVITHFPPSDLEAFTDFTSDFMPIVIEALDVAEYTRVGFRAFYRKKYPDMDAASSALLRTGLLAYPKGEFFHFEQQPEEPNLSWRWEGESTGARLHFAARKRKLEFEPRPDISELEPMTLEVPELTFDVDYYTVRPVRVGQIRLKDWIEQAFHMIKRDTNKILAGG